MAAVAVGLGFTTNLFRDTPLPLAYASKRERIQQAAERIAQGALESERPSEITAEDAEGLNIQYSTRNVQHPSEMRPEVSSAVHPIDLDTFREMQKHALILDARPEIFHRFGHVPKALSLPRDEFETYYTKQRTLLEKHKDSPVAIYCTGGSCEDGEMVASALIRLGFTQVHLFRGGWHEWTQAKLPEEKDKKF